MARHPEIIGAAARMAIGANHVVDNLHAGGIAAAVDVQTGILSRASNLGADASLGWLDRHPVTGARIAGTRLPMWDDVREFALRAHRGFSDRVLIGWDIAITPDGPVMVEGNGSPDLDIMQRFVPAALVQLRNDRPDAFVGSFGTESFKPAEADPTPFDDSCFHTFVQAVVSAVQSSEDESASSGVAGMADAKSERARRWP